MNKLLKYLYTINAIALCIAISTPAGAAGVSARGGTASRAAPVKRISTAKTTTVSNTKTETPTVTSATTETEEEVVTADSVIEDKTSTFDSLFEDTDDVYTTSTTNNGLADMIRAQRAAADTKSETAQIEASLSAGGSSCDTGLRQCMQETCGKDFTNCALDGDTIWGDKMDKCRRKLKCTGHEYSVFSAEIKADRDMNVKLASYNAVINCGNEYNACIEEQCGSTFNNCLGKSAGDSAIAKCAQIAKKCTEQDSGLAARTMNVFGTLRQDAEGKIATDEKRLYSMRDEMESACKRVGAMFDARSFNCVFSVELWAGDTMTSPTSTKKLYAGGSFDCNQEWFGIDVTTFKENAYRATREQSSATSALMGAGIGVGVGAVTSGAIDRAINTKKAGKAACEAEGKKWNSLLNKCGDEKADEETQENEEDSPINETDQTDEEKTTTDDTPASESGAAGDNNEENKKPDEEKTPTDGTPASESDAAGNNTKENKKPDEEKTPTDGTPASESDAAGNNTKENKKPDEEKTTDNSCDSDKCAEALPNTIKYTSSCKVTTSGKCYATACIPGYCIATNQKGNSNGYCKKGKRKPNSELCAN